MDNCQRAGTLLTGWHFTAGRFNCRTSAALQSQQTWKKGKYSSASSSQPERYRVCVGEDVGDTEMDNLNYPAVVPVEMPVGLTHLDSDLCWCDPIVEVDEDGEHVLVHRQVTWN